MGVRGAERRFNSIMKSLRIEALGPLLILFSLAAALLAAPPARAAEPDLVTFNAGPIEILDPETRLQIGAELRFPPLRIRWLPRFLPELSPVAGGLFASRGTLYIYGGLRYDLPLPGSWFLSPQLAAGLYSHEQGIDLGGALEFRSGIELSRGFRGGRSRAGLLLFHLSNGHLYGHNPGTEALVLTYSLRP
jgi:lipid A 3-O-deacylase